MGVILRPLADWNNSHSPLTTAQGRASSSGQPTVCSGLVVENLGSSRPCSAFFLEVRVPALISQLVQVLFSHSDPDQYPCVKKQLVLMPC